MLDPETQRTINEGQAPAPILPPIELSGAVPPLVKASLTQQCADILRAVNADGQLAKVAAACSHIAMLFSVHHVPQADELAAKARIQSVVVSMGSVTDEQAARTIAESWRRGVAINNSQHFRSLDLTPFHGRHIAPPAFPLTVMGDKWAKWIGKKAEAAGAPVAYVAGAALATVAALIGNARRVQAWPGWEEPSILWMAIVGDPSAGKSPALRPALKLIEPIDREFVSRFAIVTAEYEAKLAMVKAAKEDWEARAKAARKKGEPVPSFPSDAITPESPVCKALRVDDATIEKLAAIANVSPKGMLMAKDELAGLLANLNRYSGGNDRPHWLEAYNGDERRIDRQKTAKPLMIANWSVSILGGIQPDRFRDLMAKSGDNDGLSARFLYCWPDPVPPKRPERALPWEVDPAEIAARRLFGLSLVNVQGHDQLEPHIIPLANDTANQFQLWREAHDKERVEGLTKDAWGKMPGQTLRIALALELMQWAMIDPLEVEPKEISLASLEGALTLIDQFFKPMARRVFADAGQPIDLSAATALARWIAETKTTSFNAVALRQGKGCPAIVRDAKYMDQACGVLIEAGWLELSGGRSGDTKGRTSKDYRVNPTIWEALGSDQSN